MATKKTTAKTDPDEFKPADAVGEPWVDVIERKGTDGLPAHAALEAEINVSPALTEEAPEPEPEPDPEPETKEVKKADTK